MTKNITTEAKLESIFKFFPPIVQAAIMAIVEHEENLDPIGYDLSYYLEDLPKVVAKAIEPWRGM